MEEIQFDKVASPPEMDSDIEFVGKYENRRYNFEVPERGVLVLSHVSVRSDLVDEAEVPPDVDPEKYFVTDKWFDGNLPNELEEHIREYFTDRYEEDIDILINV